LARIYASRLSDKKEAAQLELVVPFLHLILPEIFFYGITALATAALNARRRFVAAAYAPVLNNLVVTAILVYLALTHTRTVTVTRGGRTVVEHGHALTTTVSTVGDSTAGKLILGLGTTAGIAAMAIVLIPAMKRAGIRLRWLPDWRHPAVKRVARLSGWTVGYVAANQLALFVVLALANGHGAGTPTAYQNAFIYFQLPHGLISVSVMTAILPELSTAAARQEMERFRSRFLTGLRLILVLVVPAAIGYVFLGGSVTQLFLRHGQYTAADARLAGRTLVAFAWGLPGFSVYLLALRGFYALKDTRTPFWINCAENGLNLVLAVALSSYGAPGLATAYAVAYGVFGVVAVVMLGRRIGGFGSAGVQRLVDQILRIVAASAVMGLAIWLALPSGPLTGTADAFAAVLRGVVAGATVFALAAWALRLDGVEAATTAIRRRLDGRTGRRPTP
jgi:putative peptidoglycan lipid II flippase